MIVFPFLFTAFRIKFHSGRSVKDKVDFASAKSILRKCMLSEEEVRILFKCLCCLKGLVFIMNILSIIAKSGIHSGVERKGACIVSQL